MSSGAIIGIGIAVLAVLAVVLIAGAARRRDTGEAIGDLSRETRKRDKSAAALEVEKPSDGRSVEKPVYDFQEHVRSSAVVQVPPADVIVIDGILLFVDPRVRDLCNVKVFVDADPDIRLIRRIRRDMTKRGRTLPEILDQYLSTAGTLNGLTAKACAGLAERRHRGLQVLDLDDQPIPPARLGNGAIRKRSRR